MDVVLAPDIYVNASIALGSSPERAVRRAFGGPVKPKTSIWVMERVESMLHALPEFKDDAVAQQMTTIRGLVDVIETKKFFIEDWNEALVALAEAAEVARVLTDHPDLLANNGKAGVEFVSSDDWLGEQLTPPPPPLA
jgi:pterin-4a-carbinolamine dehydratase